MPEFAIAHLRDVETGSELPEYRRRIDATLRSFQGRFRVHGAEPQVVEGSWPGQGC